MKPGLLTLIAILLACSSFPTSAAADGKHLGWYKSSGQISFDPSSLSFGTITVGTTNTLFVSLSNTGTTTVSVSQATMTGSAFSVSGLAQSFTLAPGQSTSFKVTFAPQGTGTLSGSLSIFSTAAKSPTSLSLAGIGGSTSYAQLAVNPSSLSFGTPTVGTSSTLPLIMSNTGTATTAISGVNMSGTGFSVTGLSCPMSLAPGQSKSFSVNFLPASAGTVNGSLSLMSNAVSAPATVLLTGTGVSAFGQIVANPTSLNFGTVTTGSSKTLSVTLSNTGNASTTISQDTVTGAGFTAGNLGAPMSLSPGQSASLNVTFAPQTSGTITGSVFVMSDATNSPTGVSLSGTGATPVTHSVGLSWAPSSSVVVGYNIYRSGQSGGPYTRINSSLEPDFTFTDNTVQGGQTYYYVSTGVDSSGAESGYSNQTQAVIPHP